MAGEDNFSWMLFAVFFFCMLPPRILQGILFSPFSMMIEHMTNYGFLDYQLMMGLVLEVTLFLLAVVDHR